jgi:hypothetical protein
MTQFDRDGDGKLSRDEAPEPMRDSFSQLDTNGDGFIDAAELSALQKRSGRGGGGAGARGQRAGARSQDEGGRGKREEGRGPRAGGEPNLQSPIPNL